MTRTLPLILTASAAIQAGAPELTHSETLGSGDLYLLDSEYLGAAQRITIGLPDSYAASVEGYPLLVVLDGEEYFQLAYATARVMSSTGEMPEVIVVGLETDDPLRFYTPTNAPIPDGTPVPRSGGGADYLDFIELEVIPAVNASFPTEPYTVMFGHSMAGMFALYALIDGRGVIDGVMASSPSLWWDRELVTALVPSWEHEDGSMARIFVSMGGEGETMLPPAERFVEEAGNRPGTAVLFRQFPGTSHQLAPFKSFPWGLEHIFSPWSLGKPAEELTLDEAVEHYEGISATYDYSVPIPEGLLNRLGYSLMGLGDLEGALEAFRMNVEIHPGSSNVYDSLGEALMAAGDTTEALKNYARSLELDPGNDNAREILGL